MANLKSSNGLKKVNYSRRPQRKQKALKRKNKQQEQLISQSVLDRNDRSIGFAKWQQKRVTLSQLILPKPSNSKQKDGNEVKMTQQKRIQKIPLKQHHIGNRDEENQNKEKKLENHNAKVKSEFQISRENPNEENKEKKLGNHLEKSVEEDVKKSLQNGVAESQQQFQNGNIKEIAMAKKFNDKKRSEKSKVTENIKERKKKKELENGQTIENVDLRAKSLEQNGQMDNINAIHGQQQHNENDPLLIPSLKNGKKVENNNCPKELLKEKNKCNGTLGNENDIDASGIIPLTIDTFPQENEIEDAILTECSIDSGIEINNGNIGSDVVLPLSLHKSSDTMQSIDNMVEKKEEPNNGIFGSEEKEPKVTKFEKRVYEFVDEVTERMDVQTTLLVNNELIAPMLQPLKVEPLNLERIRLSEKKQNKKPRQYKLLESDIEYCKYLEEKYGQNYEAMSHDPKNVFGDSCKSLERKLRIYKDFLKQNGSVN